MVERRPIPVLASKARGQPPSLWPSAAEQVVVWLLAMAAVAAPACFGASGIWARWTLEAAISLAAVLWSTSRLRPAALTLLPLGVAAIALLQIAPVPDSLLVRMAPISAGAWKVALGGSPAHAGCISVDPGATLTAIRRLLLALAIVAVVSDLGRVPKYRLILTRALAASGIVILLAAIIFGRGRPDFTMMRGLVNLRGPIHPLHSPLIMPVQGGGVGTIDLISVGNQQYLVDSPHTGDGCGFYIYSNHFAGGVILTLPVLIAVWLGPPLGRLPPVFGQIVGWGLYCAGLWAVGWLAESRAGVASMFIAGIVLAALVTERPWLKNFTSYVVISSIIVGTIAAALLLGPFQTNVIEALPKSGQEIVRTVVAANGRMMATMVGLRMFRASPLLGTGLNSYQAIFPRFHQGTSAFFYAHSDWAQLLAEWGITGATIALACIWALWRRGWQFYRAARPPQRTIDAGAWSAVAAIVFYSAFDWNLHLPANSLLACIVFGLAISSVPPSSVTAVKQNRWQQIGAQGVLAVGCLAAFGGLTRDARSENAQRMLNRAIVANRIANTNPNAASPRPLLLTAIAVGDSAALHDPRNCRLLTLMGQANLHLAVRTEDTTARDAFNEMADFWFARAQRASAVCRGLPERKKSTP